MNSELRVAPETIPVPKPTPKVRALAPKVKIHVYDSTWRWNE